MCLSYQTYKHRLEERQVWRVPQPHSFHPGHFDPGKRRKTTQNTNKHIKAVFYTGLEGKCPKCNKLKFNVRFYSGLSPLPGTLDDTLTAALGQSSPRARVTVMARVVLRGTTMVILVF